MTDKASLDVVNAYFHRFYLAAAPKSPSRETKE